MREIASTILGLPLGPHRGKQLVCSITDLQILTLSPLGEKISLELKHQAKEVSLYGWHICEVHATSCPFST